MPTMNPKNREAAFRSLDGLSVGDAFGECFFSIQLNPMSLEMHLSTRTLPNWKWRWTDDTAMAVSIMEVLERRGEIDQDELAFTFGKRYAWDDRRGYGGTAHGILRGIHNGFAWSEVSSAVMSGSGSMGNGGAMRVAPLGAFFAGNTDTLVTQAIRSAEITHAHPEGKAGAVAVALAAAYVLTSRDVSVEGLWFPYFDYILQHTPDSETRARIAQARDLPPTYSVETAISVLGNGSNIIAPDTVPFCLWCAARAGGDFCEGLWTAVSGGGDMDTNCAIVGGILAAAENGAPPEEWKARREPLPAPI